MERTTMLLIGSAVLFAALLFAYAYLSTSAAPVASECNFDEQCTLSNCDCRCHPAGQTPEELEGIFCGINCGSKYNITKCVCNEHICKAS